MDLSFVNNHLSKDITQAPWTAGLGSPAARTDESFADHLQPETPPATAAAATHAAPIENAPTDTPPHREEEDPQAVDDAAEPGEEGVAAVIAEEPPAPQVDASDTVPIAHRAADEPVVAPDKIRRTAERPKETDATAGVKTAGTNDADSTASDAPERSAVQPNPVKQPVSGPVIGQATPTQTQTQTAAPRKSSADLAVVTEAAPDAPLASATTAATEKSSGKPKTEKPTSTARSTGAQQRGAAASAGFAVTPDTAAAVEVDLHAAHRVADLASTELPAAEQSSDQAATTGAPEGDARPQTSPRAHALTDRFPEQLFARGSTGPISTHELIQADQQRLIQRVARAMEAASQRGGLLRLRLRPPELGSLRLEVSVQDGNLSAKIETETQATKSLLLDQLPQLRDRLAERGFHVTQFDVDVSEQHSGDAPFEPPDAERPLPVAPARHRAADPTESPAELAPNQFVYAQPGKLNVVI